MQEKKEKPNYYAIVPAIVRYDEDVTPNAKLLYAEITALCNEKGYCWSSNEYFASLYKVSKTSISKWVNQLNKKGYIKLKIIYKKGTKQIQERRLYLIDPIEEKLNTYITKIKDPIEEKLNTPIEEKLKDNNTSTNNTFNNKENIKRKKYFEDADLNDIFIEFLELRKKLKAVNSERAIKSLITKLSKYDDDIKKKMIEKSIISSWKDVYELKETKKDNVPEWFDKEIKQEDLTEQELKEMEAMMSDF